MRRASATLAVSFALAAALGGCVSTGYYLQAIGGQLELWHNMRPAEIVHADPAVSPAVKDKLAAALRIREFASRELGLPDNGSYRQYADLQRPYVVWNVFAADELSIKPKEWCYPVAGCVGYRGYFSKADADAFADELRRQGYDVYVGGVPAYSTLGWFDDPLLSTFILYPDAELARLIFHELAHQLVYAKGDSEFNESFAVTVEQEGVRRWLAQHGDAKQRAAFEVIERRREGFYALVLDYRGRLEMLYASGIDAAEKRRRKADILAELQQEYRRLKAESWDGFAGYDRWFAQNINNATLASIGIYRRWVSAFETLLVRRDKDLPRFYTAVKALATLPAAERRHELAQMQQEGGSALAHDGTAP